MSNGSLLDEFAAELARQVAQSLDEAAKVRMSALFATRSVMPEADVYDRVRLARYIVTGNEELTSQESQGYTVELGGETFTQAQWDAVQVYCAGTNAAAEEDSEPDPGPDPDPAALTGVVGPDPEFEAVLEGREPAPSVGRGWLGRRGSGESTT
jgi:hypothetical protein